MAQSSGLSDVLRDMAERPASQPTAKPSRPAARPTAPPPPPDDEEYVVAEVEAEDDAGDAVAPAATPRRSRPAAATPFATPSSAAASSRRRAPAPPPPNYTLKEVGACVFTTVSLLMLVWAVWGTMILLDMEIWRHDQPGARTMAQVSQVFYLLAAVGLGYSIYLFIHIAKLKQADKAAAARRRR